MPDNPNKIRSAPATTTVLLRRALDPDETDRASARDELAVYLTGIIDGMLACILPQAPLDRREDIRQDSLLVVLRNLEERRVDDQGLVPMFKAFTKSVVSNRVKQEIQRQMRDRSRCRVTGLLDGGELPPAPIRDEPRGDDLRQLAGELHRALSSPKCAYILFERAVADTAFRDIGVALSMSEEAVRARFRRLTTRLRADSRIARFFEELLGWDEGLLSRG